MYFPYFQCLSQSRAMLGYASNSSNKSKHYPSCQNFRSFAPRRSCSLLSPNLASTRTPTGRASPVPESPVTLFVEVVEKLFFVAACERAKHTMHDDAHECDCCCSKIVAAPRAQYDWQRPQLRHRGLRGGFTATARSRDGRVSRCCGPGRRASTAHRLSSGREA